MGLASWYSQLQRGLIHSANVKITVEFMVYVFPFLRPSWPRQQTARTGPLAVFRPSGRPPSPRMRRTKWDSSTQRQVRSPPPKQHPPQELLMSVLGAIPLHVRDPQTLGYLSQVLDPRHFAFIYKPFIGWNCFYDSSLWWTQLLFHAGFALHHS